MAQDPPMSRANSSTSLPMPLRSTAASTAGCTPPQPFLIRGLRPRTPYTLSRGGPLPSSVRVARCAGSRRGPQLSGCSIRSLHRDTTHHAYPSGSFHRHDAASTLRDATRDEVRSCRSQRWVASGWRIRSCNLFRPRRLHELAEIDTFLSRAELIDGFDRSDIVRPDHIPAQPAWRFSI